MLFSHSKLDKPMVFLYNNAIKVTLINTAFNGNKNMAVLTVNNIIKSFGTEIILDKITFEVQKGDRIGFVGINGSGKTTLFKTITGEYTPDEGSIVFAKETIADYMEQHVCKDLYKTAFDEVMTVFSHFIKMEKDLEILSDEIAACSDDNKLYSLILKQTEINDRYVSDGGLTCRSLARSTLIGLGFKEEQLTNRIEVLSGGQKAKLQLAKMLLSGSNLLLLDEPTNHLDITSVEWLEDFLKSYNGSFIVVSHDRYFLDKVTNRTFEIEYRKLTPYKGNYSTYLKLKEENRLAQQRVYDSTQKEISRVEGIIEQQRRWNQARNFTTIASKEKVIERLERDLVRPDDDPENIKFAFKASRRSGNDVLEAENLSLSFGDTEIFKNVNLEVKYQNRIFLIGPNGCGKTSLLKILLDIYEQSGGTIKFGSALDIGYYEQSQSGLNDSKTVIDEIWDLHPQMTMTEVRNSLAVFLFRGDDVYKSIGALSGGERARILLLKLMLAKTNFLLLDEPTNHLDIGSREALENALSDYDGTMFIVSHDRYLINKLADKVCYLDKNGTTLYLGNYDDYVEKRANQEEIETKNEEPRVNLYKQRKEQEAAVRKLKSAAVRCEKELEENEKDIKILEEKLLDPEISADYQKILDISTEIANLNNTNEKIFSEWSKLTSELEQKNATQD